MQYCLYPASGKTGVSSLIECLKGAPAAEGLALCRVGRLEVDARDGSWSVYCEGPAGAMDECVSELSAALAAHLEGTAFKLFYSPDEKDSWIKDSWAEICEEASASCGLSIGLLLSCEPEWEESEGRLCILVASEAHAESLRKRGADRAIVESLRRRTGQAPEISFTASLERQRDYKASIKDDSEPAPPVQEKPHAAKSKSIIGRPISSKPMPISKATRPSEVVIMGTVVKTEVYAPRRGGAVLNFVITDGEGSIYCRYSADDEASLPELSGEYIVAGELVIDEPRQGGEDGEPIVIVSDIQEAPEAAQANLRPCNRVELHCHTKMSALDSVCEPEDLLDMAKAYGFTSIAVTDHGVVHSFPGFWSAAVKRGIKPIFGMEGYLSDEGSGETHHFTVIAMNREGLTNLYRMVSASHLEHFRRHPIIPRELAVRHREGLLYGTACASGELFSAVLRGEDDEALLKVASFYDFVELMPAENSSFLVHDGKLPGLDSIRALNKKLAEVAKSAGRPFVATGDVHFVRPQDSVLRKVLLAGQDYRDVDDQPSLHLRSTEEMLEEFAYLGAEDCLEAVVIAPNMIAGRIESMKPVPDGLHTPVLEGAAEGVKKIATEEAERLYGTPLPAEVEMRLQKELSSIIGNGFSSIYTVAMRLVKKSLEDGYLVGSRGSVGSSLVATLMGITEVNPLPPHYRCPSCRHSDFGPFAAKHGFDLPNKACPVCGGKLSPQGHDIPFEVFLGFEGDKVPDIDLNFSGEYQPRIHKFSEEMFGSENVFRAGTIATIAEKTAYGFVRAYEKHIGKSITRAEAARLAVGTSGVRRTTGQHPGGIIVLPEGHDIHEFTPVQHPANAKEKGIITTHFEYTALHDNLLKLDLLGHDDPTVIRMLEDVTGTSFREIPFDDPETMSIFSGVEALKLDAKRYAQEVGTIGIPEFGTRFVRGMLAETRPRTFDELVRISGLSHGTNVWLNNAQEVIRSGDGALADVISVRDDIMNLLISKGMPPKLSFQIMEKVRKGRGLTLEDEKTMRKAGIPSWYIDSCNKIKYMFPKAHACAYVMMAFRIAYAKVHRPEAFYSAYLSIRATDFDPSFAVMGIRDMEKLMRSIDSNKDATQKEKDTVPVLELLREAVLRGFKVKGVDLMQSHPDRFVADGKDIRAPLLSVPRLGLKPALAISSARAEGPFESVEELRVRAGLSKAHTDALRDTGALQGMRESMHMELF